MCGRYVQARTTVDLRVRFNADVVGDLPEPSWNIKPTQNVPILLESHKEPGSRLLTSARWALTPPWSTTLQTRMPLFNARIETVLDKPSFKASAKNRRCVIPATGYYEWTGDKGSRVPHYIHLPDEPGQEILFAGLHSWWREPGAGDGTGWHLTTTMLTMDSYGPMQTIHPRIPVFMSDDMLADWLDPTSESVPELYDAVAATSREVGDRLAEHTVAPLTGDGPALLTAV